MDEIWSYVGVKEARRTPEHPAGWGEAYTFVALDLESRAVISFQVGRRDQVNTDAFVSDLRARLVMAPQITTDGFTPYIEAIARSFGGAVDYLQCMKNYSRGGRRDDHRYEPPRDPFMVKLPIMGVPDIQKASTSHVERQNRTIRMHIRRMTRLADAFSKKLENHVAATALHFAYYDLVRAHETLGTTPAVKMGVLDRPLSVLELVEMALDAAEEPAPARAVPQPLALPERHRTAARELPGGRGWLRVVRTGDAPAPSAPSTTPAAKLTEAPPVEDERQGDLFAWAAQRPAKPRLPVGTQLSLFGDEPWQ
ncbi:MAG: IS1 family transposase [Polyangiaceae bacterium]|nr:IS1 family transposase [Polyangiaceae bacterium]